MDNPALAGLFEAYREDPVFFVEHALGVYTWSTMRQILVSVRDNKKTAVKATHSSSKTFTAACCVAWFYNCFFSSRIITTAPTDLQVKKLLWTEINKLYRTSRIKLEGKCFQTSITGEDAEHDAVGFATTEGGRAEGFHAPELLYIFDEAKAVPGWMWDASMGALTGGFSRQLVISTTDGAAPGEDFYEIFRGTSGADWTKISIDCKDTPFFTDEAFRSIEWINGSPFDFEYRYTVPDKLASIQLATPEWESECIRKWGEDSILYLTKCRGRIVDDAPDTIIPLSHIYRMETNFLDTSFDDTGVKEIGIDVARFGDDASVLFLRKGLKVNEWEQHNKQDTVYIADRAEALARSDKGMCIKIDDTGVGGGVTDILKSRGYYNIIPINFHGTAKDPDRFPDVISEMWFEVADMVPGIACPRIERLEAELVNRKRKELDSKGRRVVESKAEYKKRLLGKSPDFADAFLLAFYTPKPASHKLNVSVSGQRYSRGILSRYGM